MRIAAVCVLVVALVCTSLCTTTLNVLCCANEAINRGEIFLQTLTTGQVHHIFASPFMWRTYPTVPQPMILVDIPSLLALGIFTFAVIHVVRRRVYKPWLLAGVSYLILPAALWTLCYALLRNNTVPERCGPWLARTLGSSVFSLIACSVFAVLEIIRFHQPQSVMVVDRAAGLID